MNKAKFLLSLLILCGLLTQCQQFTEKSFLNKKGTFIYSGAGKSDEGKSFSGSIMICFDSLGTYEVVFTRVDDQNPDNKVNFRYEVKNAPQTYTIEVGSRRPGYIGYGAYAVEFRSSGISEVLNFDFH